MTASFVTYETLNRANYEAFQRKLIPKKQEPDVEFQLEFLENVERGGDAFAEMVRSNVGTTEGEIPAVPNSKIGVSEALDVPWSTEEEFYGLWNNLAPFQAALPEFWARLSIELIQRDRIEHTYLAKRKFGEDGRSRLVRLIRTGGASDQDKKEIVTLIRDILRRSGGIYRDRAKRTVYLDCPIAKSWWRYRFASEIVRNGATFSVEQLSVVLRNSGLWEELIQAMVSRLTVIGATAIRDASVQFIATNRVIKKEHVKRILNEVGSIAADQALPAMSASQVSLLLQSDLSPIIEELLHSADKA